jgi:lipopolysaccharide/colanic/teichoic acid biosynthesis glycosyltransferase
VQNVETDTELTGEPQLVVFAPSSWQCRVKRAMDVVGAAFALLLLSPLLLAIGIAILCTDGLPLFYRWCVIGKNGVPFTSWKFRTMVRDADQQKQALQEFNEMQGPVFKMRHDPRITLLGRILRRYSLDEFPQFWSVLKGDMSLVGPRPPLVSEYEGFTPWQRQKLSVTPGLTCLWQISGRSDIKDFDEWVRMDLQYIQNWSLTRDLEIIWRTVLVVLRGRGAY